MINEILKIPFVISDEDRINCINDIEDFFVKDDWIKDEPYVPYYQTWPILFELSDKHWINIKERVTTIIRLFNPKCNIFTCWAFVSFVGKKGSLGNGWHTHFKEHNDRISSLIYLQIENENNGTMFNLGDKIIIPKAKLDTLYVYNANVLHSPTYWDYKNATKNRIVLAIDASY
jgi:hypothetical protein